MYRIIMSMILSNYYTFIGQSHCVFVVLYIFMDERADSMKKSDDLLERTNEFLPGSLYYNNIDLFHLQSLEC